MNMLYNMPMSKALEVWSSLEQAYYEDNRYGGDTAEIYVYQFMSGNPRDPNAIEKSGIFGDLAREDYGSARQTMFDLFTLFAKQREARIEVDGRLLGRWMLKVYFTHRVHVKVTPKKVKK